MFFKYQTLGKTTLTDWSIYSKVHPVIQTLLQPTGLKRMENGCDSVLIYIIVFFFRERVVRGGGVVKRVILRFFAEECSKQEDTPYKNQAHDR